MVTMSTGIPDCGRSLCKGHASEWGIIKSQHRRGPPTAWPLGKDGQEQTRLNERRSFSRYRPAYKLAGIFYLRHRYQGLCGRTRPFLKIHRGRANLSMVPRMAIISFRDVLAGISMPVYERRR